MPKTKHKESNEAYCTIHKEEWDKMPNKTQRAMIEMMKATVKMLEQRVTRPAPPASPRWAVLSPRQRQNLISLEPTKTHEYE